MKNATQTQAVLALLHLLSGFDALGDVLVQHQNVKQEEFAQYLTVDGKGNTSFSVTYQELYPSQRQVQELRHQFHQAEAAFLNESLATAEGLFTKLLQRRLDADWKPQERDLIMQSYLRWAQLSTDPGQQKRRIFEAVHFDPFYQPSPELFPPELLTQFAKLKSQELHKAKSWSPSLNSSTFDIVLVNGRPYDIHPETRIPLFPAAARLTFLSNTYVPESRVIRSLSEADQPPPLQPFINGECYSPMGIPYIKELLQEFTAIYPNNCLRHFHRGQWDTDAIVELTNISSGLATSDYQPSSNTALPLQASPSETSSLKPWHWMAMAAAATFIYLQFNGSSPANPPITPKVVPTHY